MAHQSSHTSHVEIYLLSGPTELLTLSGSWVCPMHTGHVAACWSSLEKKSYITAGVGGRRVGTREITCVSPSLLCWAPICFLSLSDVQQELGSQVETGGPGFSSGITNPCEEPSDFATQLQFPFGNGHSVFSCFLNSYQPRMQPPSSRSEKPLLFFYSFNSFISPTNVCWVPLCARYHVVRIHD